MLLNLYNETTSSPGWWAAWDTGQGQANGGSLLFLIVIALSMEAWLWQASQMLCTQATLHMPQETCQWELVLL